MDFPQLRYFSEVAAAGSYRGASERLHLTEPGIWKQVRLLERELGVALFVRQGRRVQLTQAGSLLLERVDQALASIDRIRQLADDLHCGRAGTVLVGCGPAHIPHFLGPLLKRFRQTYPDVRVELREYPRQEFETNDHLTSSIDDLVHGRIDLITSPRTVDGLDGFVVFVGRLVAVLPEEDTRLREDGVPIERLRDQPLLVQEGADAVRMLLDSACHMAGFEPSVKIAGRFASTLVALGQSGSGIPIMFDYILKTTNPRIGAPISDGHGILTTPVWLYWRKEAALLPAVEAFVAEARAFVSISDPPPSRTRHRS